MRKFLPGGRCGGSTESIKKEDTQGVSTSFNSLLAQRDAQIAQMWAKPAKTETQLVVVQPKEEKKHSKDQLINTILDGDY
jgi:hypothetical protein